MSLTSSLSSINILQGEKSIVMLIFLLFSDQIWGAKVYEGEEGGASCLTVGRLLPSCGRKSASLFKRLTRPKSFIANDQNLHYCTDIIHKFHKSAFTYRSFLSYRDSSCPTFLLADWPISREGLSDAARVTLKRN